MIKKYRRDISIEDLLNSGYQFGYNFDAINGIEGKVVSKIATKIYNIIVSKENKEGTSENIINDKLWKMISNKYNQTLYYEEIICNQK